jgi:malate synthase
MEDAATAEICRTQLWQWLKYEAPLADSGNGGRRFTPDLFEQWFEEEVGLLAEIPNIAEAARLMHNMIVSADLVEFLTLPAYDLLD